MAYIFHQDDLPKLVAVVPGRERTFFVNKELTNIDDMLAGVMEYKAYGSSPYHYHEICEHFYFIMEGRGTVETEEGVRPVGPGDMVFIPAEAKHRLSLGNRSLLLRVSGAQSLQDSYSGWNTGRFALESRRRPCVGADVKAGCNDPNINFHRYDQTPARQDAARRSCRDFESAAGGAKNVLGTLRWLSPGERFEASPLEKHQLIYLMEGNGSIRLDQKDYEVSRGAGVYLGPRNSRPFKPALARR